MAAKKWDMAAAVANHMVKVEPEEAGWWISLAYATRRGASIEEAKAILLSARELHHDNALIEFNLACYASVTGRLEEAKAYLQHAIELDKEIRGLALDDDDLKPLWDRIAVVVFAIIPKDFKRSEGGTTTSYEKLSPFFVYEVTICIAAPTDVLFTSSANEAKNLCGSAR